MDIRVGDVLTMKKKHPCGSCGREIMNPRSKIEKGIKKVERGQPEDGQQRPSFPCPEHINS